MVSCHQETDQFLYIDGIRCVPTSPYMCQSEQAEGDGSNIIHNIYEMCWWREASELSLMGRVLMKILNLPLLFFFYEVYGLKAKWIKME